MLSSHRFLRRILGSTVAFALCATTVGCGAAGKSGAAKSDATGKTLSAALCDLSAGELSAADIDAPCVQVKTSHTSYKAVYSAEWGANARGHAFHSLAVSLTNYTGATASRLLEGWRRNLLPEGRPFNINGIGSVLAETISGIAGPPAKPGGIPPFVTHKRGEARFVVGNYLGKVVLWNDNPSASDKDLEQTLIPIARTVAAEL